MALQALTGGLNQNWVSLEYFLCVCVFSLVVEKNVLNLEVSIKGKEDPFFRISVVFV